MNEHVSRLALQEYGQKGKIILLNPPIFSHEGKLSLGQAVSCTLVDILVRYNRLGGKNVIYSPKSYNVQGKQADMLADVKKIAEKSILRMEGEKSFLGFDRNGEEFVDYDPQIRRSSQELFISLWLNEMFNRDGRKFYLSVNSIEQKYDIESAIDKIDFYPRSLRDNFKQIFKDTHDQDLEITRNRVFATPLPLHICGGCSMAFPATTHLSEQGEFDPRKISDKCPECGAICLNKEDESISPLFDLASQAYFLQRKYGQCRTLMISGRNVLARYSYQSFLIGMALNGKSPFDAIVVHSFLNDEKGKRMSKMNNNVVYVNDIIANNQGIHPDAIRYALVKSISLNADRSGYDRALLEGGQKFVYRIGNLRRFFVTNNYLLLDFQPNKEALNSYISFMNAYDLKSAFGWIENHLVDLSLKIKRENDQGIIHDLKEEGQTYTTSLWALEPFMPSIVEKSKRELGLTF